MFRMWKKKKQSGYSCLKAAGFFFVFFFSNQAPAKQLQMMIHCPQKNKKKAELNKKHIYLLLWIESTSKNKKTPAAFS